MMNWTATTFSRVNCFKKWQWMWFSFSASFSHSCATLHLLCMREPVGHNFQNCWKRWEGKIHWWPFRLINIYAIFQCHVPSSQLQKYCNNHFSLADGVEHPTMPVDRGLEVCEFQTAQHWDLRNNQLRSTLGSRSDFVGVLLGSGIRGIIPVSKSWLFLQRRSKMCGFGHGWFVADAEMSLGWMELGSGIDGSMKAKWWEPTNLVPNVSWWPFSIHKWLLLWLFPGSPFLWGDKSSWQQWRFSGGFIKSYKGQASVDNSSRWQCLSICFFDFLVLTRKERETKTSQLTWGSYQTRYLKMTVNRELWTCQDIREAWCSDTT